MNEQHKKRGRLFFIISGLVSLIWFLVRVIPKPSRAAYPCMRAAAPFASGFVIYLLTITGSFLFLKKAYRAILRNRIIPALLMVMMVLIFLLVSLLKNPEESYAAGLTSEQILHLVPNQPIGEAKGIMPGRVVWVHDPEATNPACIPSQEGNSYWEDKNTFQNEVDSMLSAGLKELTGAVTDEAAWDSIFRYHNSCRGKGKTGYADGEKIFLKVNRTSTWTGNINLADFSRVINNYYGLSETSPHVIAAVLWQLTEKAGVSQENIYVGDPMKHLYEDDLQKFLSEFPNVHYLDNSSTYHGREKVVASNTSRIFYSDKQSVLKDTADFLYTIFEETEYLINIPTMKGHKHAGVTMFAKNHFGSHTRSSAEHLHAGLVKPKENDPYIRPGYGIYRVLTDIMGHELLGKKSLIFIMDALYSTYHELANPVKWKMSPFNDHWSSSVFLSFDPVAIESVGFDFIYAEFDGTDGNPAYSHMEAVDDYLEQAADKSNWPEGIEYDPDNDKIPISSLGVHEHWDSPDSKKYSRNLGTGNGIELIYVNKEAIETSNEQIAYEPAEVYPNPFCSYTIIHMPGSNTMDNATIQIFDLNGNLILSDSFHDRYVWHGEQTNGSMDTRYYLYQIISENKMIQSGKIIFQP